MRGVISFEAHTGHTSEEAIRANIAHCKSLNLPAALGRPKTLNVVSTGPSARNVHGKIFGDTLALNGALSFYPDPDFYACCDPQELVADFLRNPHPATTYYVASKCHPKVFTALENRDVRVWDVSDYVEGGVSSCVSITATALNLFSALGYRKFSVYGWDCCYVDGEHHANAQPAPTQARVSITIGDRVFQTNTTWAMEAQDAIGQISLLEYLGIEVVIHGDSMIEAIRRTRSRAA